MSDDNESSVLRRKAQAGQEQFRARAMTAARALRVSIPKVAEDEFELALAVIGLTEERAEIGPYLENMGETILMLLLDTPGRGAAA